MRHAKRSFKLGRDSGHRRSLIANLLKALIFSGRIETTVAKAKELRRHADKMITLAKKDSLHARRLAIGRLMVHYNPLTTKEKRQARTGDHSMYNADRTLIGKLFTELGPKYKERHGGYTRIIRTAKRQGDSAPTCIIEYV